MRAGTSGSRWRSTTRLSATPRTQLAASGSPAPGVQLTGLDGPSGLAFDAAGNLWVAFTGADRVARYNASRLGASSTASPDLVLNVFQAEFPERFFDVGICEPHALTLATGLAMGGRRPVVAIYSTFLQRAFDQQVHDVCQNDQPVVIAVDRAGLVGEDGTSHQGMFTLPAQRQLPHLIIASPKDEQELRSLVRTAFAQDHPFALHYPRDPGFEVPVAEPSAIPIGQAELLRDGEDVLLIGFGPIVMRAVAAADVLAAEGWSVGVINARFAKPLDRQLILDQARGRQLVVTLEESVATGGFGSAVLELIEEARLADPGYRETAGTDRRASRRPIRGPRVRGRSAARASHRRGGHRRTDPRDADRPARRAARSVRRRARQDADAGRSREPAGR